MENTNNDNCFEPNNLDELSKQDLYDLVNQNRDNDFRIKRLVGALNRKALNVTNATSFKPDTKYQILKRVLGPGSFNYGVLLESSVTTEVVEEGKLKTKEFYLNSEPKLWDLLQQDLKKAKSRIEKEALIDWYYQKNEYDLKKAMFKKR